MTWGEKKDLKPNKKNKTKKKMSKKKLKKRKNIVRKVCNFIVKKIVM